MTRKHFEAIAKTLNEQRAPLQLCAALAREFCDANPLFNTQRFLTACGHSGE
jgi:hypothetical protein